MEERAMSSQVDNASQALDLRLKDNFDRVEIMQRLRVVEKGERTMYERTLEDALATVRRVLSEQETENERLREERDAARKEAKHVWCEKAFDQQNARAETAEAEARQLREERDAWKQRHIDSERDWRKEWLAREAAEAELQRLRGGISVRDALVAENAIRAAAAEAEVERYREGLREQGEPIMDERFRDRLLRHVLSNEEVGQLVDAIESRERRARALLADSQAGGGAK